MNIDKSHEDITENDIAAFRDTIDNLADSSVRAELDRLDAEHENKLPNTELQQKSQQDLQKCVSFLSDYRKQNSNKDFIVFLSAALRNLSRKIAEHPENSDGWIFPSDTIAQITEGLLAAKDREVDIQKTQTETSNRVENI